jgi:hypothetical protein
VTRLARIGREPGTPDTLPLFHVRVEFVSHGRDVADAIVVAEGRDYAVASQLCDALNYRFGHGGALSVLGSKVDGDLAELADNIKRRLDEREVA